MIDLSLPLRQAVVAHLNGDANILAVVSAENIHGEYAGDDPQFPFIRMGYADATGYEATCWNGSESNLSIHAFAKSTGGYTDAIYTIARRIQLSMEAFDPAMFSLVDIEWLRTNVIPDEVPEVLHAILDFRVVGIEI